MRVSLCEILDLKFKIFKFQIIRLLQLPISLVVQLPIFLAGSGSCRCGPLPLYHVDPPCSRNVLGAEGSAPRVSSKALVSQFFWRSAASTRSGEKGASRKRIPTAS